MIEDATTKYYRELFLTSQAIFNQSLESGAALSKANQTIDDVARWVSVLQPRPEAQVLRYAVQEAQLGLLALVGGLYRHAFGSLRLLLELQPAFYPFLDESSGVGRVASRPV